MDYAATTKQTLLLILALLPANVLVSAAEVERTLSIPESIASDLSTDVTAELNGFFASLPNGATVRAPAQARYRIDGTVVIEGKENLTLDGRGVLFRAFDPGEHHAKNQNYTGWKATRNRAHIRIAGGRRILIRDVEIHGAHPDAGRSGTYDPNREAQHGFDLVGVEDCTLERVTVHDVYGDCVYIARVRGVVVRGSQLTRCGRQGIAVATGEDVLIENNEIADSRRGIIDLEPYGPDWQVSNIRIIGNRLGGSRLLLLPMGGSGTIGSVLVADNISIGLNGTPAVANAGEPDQQRGPFLMINNRLTVGGSPAPGLRITHNDGVFLAGNELTFPEHRRMTALDLEGSRGAVVGNRFEGAAVIMGGSTTVTALANETASDSKSLPTDWKQISGGFAARVTLDDGDIVALMRGGPTTAPPPEKIEAYGHSTAAAFAWFHVQNGQLVNTGSRE